jgi:NAD(P)H-dependent FMN reductase
MSNKVVAIVGSYRKGGNTDTLVEAVLAGARERGTETKKIYLLDHRIEYCRNCRSCTQAPGAERGQCVIHDDVPGILSEVDSADAIVLASPENFYSATALFRTFLERLVGAAHWPWGQWSPKPRMKKLPRKAVLIATSAAPGFFINFTPGVTKALNVAAGCLGARVVAKLWVGLAAQQAKPQLSEKVLLRAKRIGAEL